MAPKAVYKYGWVPISVFLGWVGLQYVDSYGKVYNTVRWVQKSQGVQHDDPAANTPQVKAASAAAALAAGAATFEASRRLLYHILLTPSPAARRAAEAAGLPIGPQPLSLSRLFALLGPSATAATYRQARVTYGLQLACMTMASAFAILAAPVAQAQVEAAFAPVGAPERWGRDARTQAAAHQREQQQMAALARQEDARLQRSMNQAEEELRKRAQLKDSFKSAAAKA